MEKTSKLLSFFKLAKNRKMSKQILFLLLLLAVSTGTINAQKQEDPTLFTVEDVPVGKSEFVYIYSKTNGQKADFSEESLDEYLDLYVKFKLKVKKAKDMRLDTIPQLNKELEGYRRQLADSYLIDKEVTEKLIKEAYERSKQDVDISHVLIGLRANAAPQDTLRAYQKAIAVKKRIESGEEFAKVAEEVSTDRSAKRNKGHVGYITAVLPNGLYPLESAAYTLPVGQLSDPVRTTAGYHILKVNNRRPSRGEMEVAHILLRTKDKDPNRVKARIDSIHQLLQGGANFEALAKNLSEDKNTANKGGYIGFFGINRYEIAFEDAAFSLGKDGEYSAPFQTSVGWHILKRISKKGLKEYSVEKARLENQIRKDRRFEAAKVAMIERIKSENNFKEYPEVLEAFKGSLTDTFLTFKWKAPKEGSREKLFDFGKKQTVTLGDFTDYLGRSSRQRLKLGANNTATQVVDALYASFLNETCMKFEETQLENKYPDFKALMREYEEGILLFEATKILVWDMASQDTTGLKEFFNTIKGKYRWQERAVASTYRLSLENKDRINEVRDYAKDHTPEEVLEHFNTNDQILVSVETKKYEKGRNPDLNNMTWEAGKMSQFEEVARNKTIKFVKIEEVLPPAEKTLKEARGYVVADYQDHLEKQWVEQLKKEYKVKVNKKVFESLVKK